VTNDQLTNLLRVLAGMLRLRDWDIEARIVSKRDQLMNDDYLGTVDGRFYHKKALIRVLPPEEHDSKEEFLNTCVHELLHLHFRRCEPPDDSVQHEMFEQGISLVADAMVKALTGEHQIEMEQSRELEADR
jgi:hypothetical protein